MSGGIDFGGLDLTGIEDYDGVVFEAMGDGATLGNPEPVDRSVVSGLLDGSFVVTDSHSNREASFQVWIRASDSAALAHGEKMLFDRCSRPVEFGWTPPDGWGARTVFEAFTSHLEHEFDDLKEIRQLVRSYRLRIVCYPFGFSEDEVVDVAVEPMPATPVDVTISDGTSATGWSSLGGAVTSSGGVLVIPSAGPVSSRQDYGTTVYAYVDEATKALSPTVDFTATRYLSADVRYANLDSQFIGTSAFGAFPAYVDGVRLQVASVQVIAPGTQRITWRVNDASASTFALQAYYESTAASTGGFRVDNVVRRNYLPGASGLTRQAVRSLTVTGSARTTGSVAIEHPTAGLGDVSFYTSTALADGYDPSLDMWLVSGGYEVPTSLLPDGPFLVMLRAKSNQVAVPGDVTVTVSTVVNGVVFHSVTLPTITDLPFSGSPYIMVRAGVLTLPGLKLPVQSNATVRFEVDGIVQLDPIGGIWAYHLGEGSSLTQVACGAGTPSLGTVHNRLFLDAPSLANEGRAALYVGTQADRADAFHPGYPTVLSWEEHPATPPTQLMHVFASGTDSITVTRRHRPAWFTHAGQ